MPFPRVADVLKHKDGGLSVEEARKKMFEAKEAPKGLVASNPQAAAVESPVPVVKPLPPVVAAPDVIDALEPEFAEELEVPAAAVPVPVPVAKPAATVPVVPVAVPKVERVETKQFIGEIKQDGGKWVAEIRYKSGSGTERFEARSKSELMLKLLEGKGHATLRVNKAVRREKLGWSELDRQYPLPEGMTVEDFSALPEKTQDLTLWNIASQQIIQFQEAHPEYYKTQENAKKINDFLGEHKLPVTVRNLVYALDELTDPNLPADVRLEERPSASVVEAPVTPNLETPASAPAPVQTDSAPAAAAPPAASAAASAPEAPAVVVRKRGTTGLRPGDSSSPTELGTSEGGGGQRDLSEAELRKLPLGELKRIANADRRARAGQR